MSSTDKVGCISHKADTHFFVMYEDFLEVAKVSEHQYKLAAFWRVLETKTNDRKTYNAELIEHAKKNNLPPPQTDLWIELTYSDCVARSLGTYQSSSFKIASAESDRMGFSQSRVLQRHKDPLNPKSPIEDYKEYLFLSDVLQGVINGGEYPPPVEIDRPLLKSIGVRKEQLKAKRAVEINRGGVENNPTGVEINRNKNLYNLQDTKEEDSLPDVLPQPTSLENEFHSQEAHVSSELSTASDQLSTINGDNPDPIATMSTRNNGDAQEIAPQSKPARTRTPEDETLKARIERVFSTFDALKREVTGDAEAKYARTKAARSEIKENLLPCAPTEQRLRKVYKKLWDTPRDTRTSFKWSEHMTIKAVCGQYENLVIDIIAEEKIADGRKRAAPISHLFTQQDYDALRYSKAGV